VSDKPNVKILVCHHKEFEYLKNECIVPIHVGKALSPLDLDYCIGDDTGDNISERNKSWCELTAIYWAWKNLDADYYGLMHYRRYLSLNKNDGYKVIASLDKNTVNENALDKESIESLCENFDIITSPVWNVHPAGLPSKLMTNYQLYELDHYKSDLDIVVDIVKSRYPDFYLPLLDSLYSTTCFFANIAIMQKKYFHEYCDFAFGVLFEAEKKISLEGYDSYQKRIWGFLAERLINAYVIYAKQKYSNLKVKTAGMLYLTEKNPTDFQRILSKEIFNFENRLVDANKELLNPDKVAEQINVCMSFDNNYFIHAITALHSIIINKKSIYNLNVYILCDNKLDIEKRKEVQRIFKGKMQVSFIDIDPGLFSSLPLNRQYISLNTYYRLIIHKVLPNLNKIIYLDSDVIFCDDIINLWNINLKNNCIAGSLDEGGVLQSRRLSLGPTNNYINAGVLVFNLELIREKYADIFRDYIENYLINKQEIILQDQDIINITFKDNLYILPLKWNVNSRMFSLNDLEHKYSLGDEIEAVKDPGIIHYTDKKKPWNFLCAHPLRELYWKYRENIAPKSIKFKQKMIRKYSGSLNYQFEGDQVVFIFSKYKFNVSKKAITKLIRLLILIKVWK